VEIAVLRIPSPDRIETPAEACAEIPGGVLDFLKSGSAKALPDARDLSPGRTKNKDGRWCVVEWAVHGRRSADPFTRTYCNTIPTSQGGTHEQGLRNALTKALRAHGGAAKNRKTNLITADDVMDAAAQVLSL